MSDEQATQPDDGAQVDPVEAAYEQALTGGTDPYGERPAREVYAIEGVPAEQAEQEARERPEAIQKLRGAQPTGDAPPPQQPAEAQPAEPTTEPGLTTEQVAARLLGIEQQPLTETEAAYLQQQEAARQLARGEAVERAVQDTDEYAEAIGDLIERNPGIDDPAIVELMEGPYEGIAARFGRDAANDPLTIERIFREVGGPALADKARAEEAYEAALDTSSGRDAFGFPQANPDINTAVKEALEEADNNG